MAINSKKVTPPYITLAAAILNSGVKCNDTAFLESEWGQYLKAEVGAYMNKPDTNTVYVTGLTQSTGNNWRTK